MNPEPGPESRTPEPDPGDDQDVRTIEDRLIAGEDLPDERELVAFLAALRSEADRPAPAPSGELAALLTRPASAGPAVLVLHGASMRSRRRSAGRLAAQIALGGSLLAASVGAAAAVEGVPAVLQEPARALVGLVADALVPNQADSTGGETGGAGEEESSGGPASTPSESVDADRRVSELPADTPPLRTEADPTLPDADPDLTEDVAEKRDKPAAPLAPAEPATPRDDAGRPADLPGVRPTPGPAVQPERPDKPGAGSTPSPAPSAPVDRAPVEPSEPSDVPVPQKDPRKP